MLNKVFLNGKIVNQDSAFVGVSDVGLLYGAGLFETMRCHKGVVFRLNDHLDRLCAGCEKLNIKIGYDRQYLASAIYETLSANSLTEARIRLTLTGGNVNAEPKIPCLLITATNFEPYPQGVYDKGVVVVISDYKQNPSDPLCGHKTTCYWARLLALENARRLRAAESLWFTTGNHLAEGSISNVFIVKNNRLYTPPLNTPVLPGIARKTVCELAGENNIELVQQPINVNELLAADEVFLTNVIMELMPVVAIEAHTVGDGKVGPMTKRLRGLYIDFMNRV